MSDEFPTVKISRKEQQRRSAERFIDHLLLSIIAANPCSDLNKTREVRLAEARRALFGDGLSVGRPPINDDIEVFKILSEIRKPEIDALMRLFQSHVSGEKAELYEKELKRKPLSINQASKAQAIEKTSYDDRAPQSVPERLRQKAMKAKFTTRDMADFESLAFGTSPKGEVFRCILELLPIIGIKVKHPLLKIDLS